MSIHFDGRAKSEHFDAIQSALADNKNVTFAHKRIKCGWGEWSLVQATLHAVESALVAFPSATHFYMISGDCMPIKSSDYIHAFLDENDRDYVECFDFFRSDWIKTGFKKERLIYRHFFNERTQKWWFYKSFEMQKKFNLTRDVPKDIQVRIGSQWWCLRRKTIEAIVEFGKQRPDVMRFFKTTWIPDETYFQTLVGHLIPNKEIETRTLTFLVFSDYGMPATFYNDHYDFLVSQNYMFARKISGEALSLRQRLGALYNSGRKSFEVSGQGRNLYKFVTERGRTGIRFAPRFWESESTIGRDRELYIVVCKKWHVAKRLLSELRHHVEMPVLEYIFNEHVPELPQLGGILSNPYKKARHRRALMRMLYEHYETDKLMICLDPSNIELLRDFSGDRSELRVLEVDVDFDDVYVLGHAKRVGLVAENTPVGTLVGLLPSVKNDLRYELEALRDCGFANYFRIIEGDTVTRNG